MTPTLEAIDIQKSNFWEIFEKACDRCQNAEQLELLKEWLDRDNQRLKIESFRYGKRGVAGRITELKNRLEVESREPQNTAETILRPLLIRIGCDYNSIAVCSIEFFGGLDGIPKYPTDKLTPAQIDSIARSLLAEWAFRNLNKYREASDLAIRRLEKGTIGGWGDIADRFIYLTKSAVV